MKKTIALLAGVMLFVAGCTRNLLAPDLTPPSPPASVFTMAGDRMVQISWSRNTEPDLAGYHVYVSTASAGPYERIGTTSNDFFIDGGVNNGTTYYYAVTAFDESGNESDFNPGLVYGTPRPEGYGVTIYNYRTQPNLAGYDFSTETVGPYNDTYSDFFFENYQGHLYLDVWTDSDIQDLGYTQSLNDIAMAPTAGWSPTKDVPVISGHTYVVWTWDDHYAKVRVISVTASQVKFDWAYQTASGNAELKHSKATSRASLAPGSGILDRL